MSYKYILNPNYNNFKDDLINIKDIFINSELSIHKARNELKIIEIQGIRCVIKAFKIPHIINRIAYTFFRDGKAKKSYSNGIKLLNLDITTPEPIGIIEFFKNGLLEESYFISLYEPYDFTIREVFRHEVEDCKNILIQFSEFTYNIHQKQVWHEDYTSGNILITKQKDNYKFSLVDINRMQFKEITNFNGLLNFIKFWAKETDLEIISNKYAEFSNLDKDKAFKFLLENTRKLQKKANLKKAFKKDKFFFFKNFINSIVPSFACNTDVKFIYNTESTVEPIMINELVLISSMKKRILNKRQQNVNLNIKRSQKKLALIVPYRHREEHLKQFIPYMTDYLTKQNIDFEIIVVEQSDDLPFNRAKLMNIGVLNASNNVDYFVFHDVDLLPENIDYRFCNHSLKLFTYIKQSDDKYKQYKQTNFGGATLVPKEILMDINGFSNDYWQWGSEDDDFFMRHLIKGYIPLYDTDGKFISLPHNQALTLDTNGKPTKSKQIINENKRLRKENSKTLSKLKRGLYHQYNNGINSCNNYKILSDKMIDHIKTISIKL